MDHTCFEAELVLLLPVIVVQSPHPHALPCRLLVEGVGAAVGLAGVEGVAAFVVGPLGAVGLPAVVAAYAGVGGKEGEGPSERGEGTAVWQAGCAARIWEDAPAFLRLQGSRGCSEQDLQLMKHPATHGGRRENSDGHHRGHPVSPWVSLQHWQCLHRQMLCLSHGISTPCWPSPPALAC